jgi:hypothetical protein
MSIDSSVRQFFISAELKGGKYPITYLLNFRIFAASIHPGIVEIVDPEVVV